MNIVDITPSSFISNNILVEWSTAVSIVVAVVSASFVALLLLTNIFSDNNSSARRKIIIQTAKSAITSYLLQFFNIILEMLRKLSELPTALIIVWNILTSNIRLIFFIAIMLLASIGIRQYDTII